MKIILEFSKADLGSVMGDSDNFTIAYEIELEEIKDEHGSDQATKDKYEKMFSALESGDLSDDEIEGMYDFFSDGEEEHDDNEDSWTSPDFSNSNFSAPDMSLKDKYFPFEEDEIHLEFPDFFRKWGEKTSLINDLTLERGFEIVQNPYLSSIDEAFDFVDDFFTDFYQQDRFEFNDRTGWHINIGINGKDLSKSNLLKGAVLLSDEFATKEFAARLESQYARPIRDYVLDSVKSMYDYEVDGENLMMQVFAKNLEGIERVGNEFMLTVGKHKEYGFNPRGRYVEFRYPGGKLTPMQIKESTLYYCYLIKAVADPSFKRKEYIKKLYKLLFGGDNQ